MELNDNDYQSTYEDVQILRRWLKQMPHLVQDYDDTFLITFIKGAKGSLQKAKSILEKFNSPGQHFKECKDHMDIFHPTTQKCLKETMLFPLPKRLENGAHVFVLSTDFKDMDSKKTNFIEVWRYWLMIFYVLVWENDPFTKSVTIFDWKNLRLGHVKEITPVLLAKMMNSLKSLPVQTIAVYNINVPPALEWLLNSIKSVVKKKFADRFHFISSIDTLHQSIPRELLPVDYGGRQDDIKTMHSHWMKKVERYRHRLVEESNKMRELDPLRPIQDDIHDTMATFRTINVD